MACFRYIDRAASLSALNPSNRLDYSVINSFRNMMKAEKIPAAQNVKTQRPARGQGSSKRGCHRGLSQAGDRRKTPTYSSSSNLPQYISHTVYEPYITHDEWNASNDELRKLIDIEKAKLRMKCLLSELTSIKAENAGYTASLFSGGLSRQQGNIESEPCDLSCDSYLSQQSSCTRNCYQSSSTSSDGYEGDTDSRRRGERGKYCKDDMQPRCSEYDPAIPDEHKGENNLVELLIKTCPQLFNLPANDSNTGDAQNLIHTSGIHDSLSSGEVVAKQTFPHSQLQPECLNGFDGEDVEYYDLSFGLFVAGEMEIISNPSTDPREAIRRQELLKITAYRSQYMPWPKLLQLHAAILKKIESGRATWESNFDSIEKMVFENPGNNRDDMSGGLGHDNACMQQRVFWCWNFNKSMCYGQHQHPDKVNGRNVLVKHICATCYYHENVERSHSEYSDQCPWLLVSSDETHE